MISRYTLIEPFRDDEAVKNLSINDKKNSMLNIFYILSGTCGIVDEFTGDKVHQDINYYSVPFHNSEEDCERAILDNFSDDFEFELDELFSVFNKVKRNNKDFYGAIEPEIINCIMARKNGRYLESFVFLYRILEGISYSIPLMYTAKSTSFTKSFTALQKYISKNSKDGEIAFFKKFIIESYSQNEFFKSSIDLNMDDIGIEELKPIYFKIYKEKLGGESSKAISDETEDEEIKVTFIGFFEFLIEIRNRYFHFLQGTWQNNIATHQIIHPDLFFKPLIDHGINWVAIIFLEIIKFEFENEPK